jgi:hypothetical protein
MFTDTLLRWIEGVLDYKSRKHLHAITTPVFDRMSSVCLVSAALRIHGGSASVLAQSNAISYYVANGVLVKVATATDMPALVGTVTNATFNVWAFFIDQGGTVTAALGVQGSTLAKVGFPQFPAKKALIGFVIINPTGTGDFVGGTTQLDDGTVVPNAVFINGTEGFDPYCLLG